MKRNGLHRFPAGDMERRLRAERRQELAEAGEFAELIGDVEVRDGRKYRVLRLDDAYGMADAPEPEVRFHRDKAQLVRELTRGPSPPTGGPAP